MPRLRSTLFPAALIALLGVSAKAQLTEHKLLASDGQASDHFGRGIAIEHGRTVIGATNADTHGANAGAVYVIHGCGSFAETKLAWSAGAAGDRLGYSVAVGGDVLVAGAPQDDLTIDGTGGKGAAIVFRWDGAQWHEEAVLTASDGANEDHFGHSVAVDGDVVVVGAPFKSTTAGTNSGKTYVFEFDGTQWSETFALEAGGTNNYGGYSVDVEGDVVASGELHSSGFTPNQVWLLRRVAGTWGVEDQIGPPTGLIHENFGMAVSLDAGRILVGAPALTKKSVGYAALFEHDRSTGEWEYVETLAASDGDDLDGFGRSLALRGEVALIGAYQDDDRGDDSGSAYVFRSDGSRFVESEKLLASDGAAGDFFGLNVATDGVAHVTGSSLDDDGAADSGSTYMFLPPAIEQYGAGLAGAGGVVPSLGATGSTGAGSAITLEIRDFAGGTFSVLLVGFAPASAPAFGGTLLVDLGLGYVPWPMALPGAPGVPGEGDLDRSETVPSGFECVSFFLQQLGLDDAAAHGVSMSNGLHVHLR